VFSTEFVSTGGATLSWDPPCLQYCIWCKA